MRKAERHQRVNASACATFKQARSGTTLERLHQNGSAKIRFPKTYDGDKQAVLINTAGGLTGGDQLNWSLALGANTHVVATTQACEKAYRAEVEPAKLQTKITLQENSTLEWLPQETILYEGSNLTRSLSVTMDETSQFVGLEALILGREAMGETLFDHAFNDRWMIRKNGKLVFADVVRLTGKEQSIAKTNGNHALASLIVVNKKDDEVNNATVKRLRGVCDGKSIGFSAFDGKIIGRMLAPDSYELRKILVPILAILRDKELPRVWRL